MKTYLWRKIILYVLVFETIDTPYNVIIVGLQHQKNLKLEAICNGYSKPISLMITLK